MLIVNISKEAQKTEARAGRPAQEKRQFEIPAELVDRAFAIGATINSAGVVELDAIYLDREMKFTSRCNGLNVHLDKAPATCLEAIESLEAIQAQEKARQENAKQEAEKKRSVWIAEYPYERIRDLVLAGEKVEGFGQYHGADCEKYAQECFARVLKDPLYQLSVEKLVCAPDRYGTRFRISPDSQFGQYVIRDIFDARPDLKAKAEEYMYQKNSELDALDATERARLRAWIANHAWDPTVLERWEAGVLPEDELKDALREVVFAPLEIFPRFKKLRASDFENADVYSEVDYDVETLEAMDADEWTTYKAIEKAAPEGSTLKARKHVAVCGEESLDRVSVLVTVERFGFTLSREYAL